LETFENDLFSTLLDIIQVEWKRLFKRLIRPPITVNLGILHVETIVSYPAIQIKMIHQRKKLPITRHKRKKVRITRLGHGTRQNGGSNRQCTILIEKSAESLSKKRKKKETGNRTTKKGRGLTFGAHRLQQ
jgi:hypothetical protein